MGQKSGREKQRQQPSRHRLEDTYLSLSGSLQTQSPDQKPVQGPAHLTTHLVEGRVCLCPSPAVAGSGLRRHLLDCAVRASIVGVKTPTPISERAASWKRYSVSGFKSSRV